MDDQRALGQGGGPLEEGTPRVRTPNGYGAARVPAGGDTHRHARADGAPVAAAKYHRRKHRYVHEFEKDSDNDSTMIDTISNRYYECL